MKRVAFVFFLALSTALNPPVVAGEKGRPKTIKGKLVEIKDKNGRLTELKLQGADGKEYQIFLNPTARKMARQSQGATVELRAIENRLGSDVKPLLLLEVKSYRFQSGRTENVEELEVQKATEEEQVEGTLESEDKGEEPSTIFDTSSSEEEEGGEEVFE